MHVRASWRRWAGLRRQRDESPLQRRGEFTFSEHVVTGLRVDHRTAQRRDPAVHLFLNGTRAVRTGRLPSGVQDPTGTAVQQSSNVTLVGLSHIF